MAVPVGGYEAERGIDHVAHDGGGDAVALDDGPPEPDARAAKRVDADPHAGRANDVHVHDMGEVRDVGTDVVVAVEPG